MGFILVNANKVHTKYIFSSTSLHQSFLHYPKMFSLLSKSIEVENFTQTGQQKSSSWRYWICNYYYTIFWFLTRQQTWQRYQQAWCDAGTPVLGHAACQILCKFYDIPSQLHTYLQPSPIGAKQHWGLPYKAITANATTCTDMSSIMARSQRLKKKR